MKRISDILHKEIKKEIVFSAVIGLLAIWSFFLMVQVDTLKKQTFSYQAEAHPYLDPTQGFYDNQDVLINMRPLREELQALMQGRNVGIYFEFLNSGANIRINDSGYWPGSLMKIPIAMAAMKKIESGDWSMDTKLVLTDADKNSGYGELYRSASGTTFTVRELLAQLLVSSDNTARSMFMRYLGEQNVSNVLTYLGLDDVFDENLKVNPQRYSNFWRALYNASYLSPESSETLLEIMSLPHDRELLQQGIPQNVTFSHKIGVYQGVYNDSGIIYAPRRPYILTVMMQSSSTDEVDAMMNQISTEVFEYVNQ